MDYVIEVKFVNEKKFENVFFHLSFFSKLGKFNCGFKKCCQNDFVNTLLIFVFGIL